jgi:hypothetical protein
MAAGKRPYWNVPRVLALLGVILLPLKYDNVAQSSYRDAAATIWLVCLVYAGWPIVRGIFFRRH